MAKTARDLITAAAQTAGVIDAIEALESEEAVHALAELNNIVETWNLDAYYPYTNVHYDVQNYLEDGFISIGKNKVFNAGPQTFNNTGSFNPLRYDIISNGDTLSFTDVNFTSDNELYYIPGTSTVSNGRFLDSKSGNTFDVIGGLVDNLSGPISSNTELTYLSTAPLQINTPEGIFTRVDIFAERPNRIISVSVDISSILRPLVFVSPNQFDNSFKSKIEQPYPYYFTYNAEYPISTIELYPISTGYRTQVSYQIVQNDFTLNDDINLPDGYYPALQYELAKVLAVHYGNFDVVPMLEKMSTERLARVKRLNNKTPILTKRGTPRANYRYNVNTDTYRGR